MAMLNNQMVTQKEWAYTRWIKMMYTTLWKTSSCVHFSSLFPVLPRPSWLKTGGCTRHCAVQWPWPLSESTKDTRRPLGEYINGGAFKSFKDFGRYMKIYEDICICITVIMCFTTWRKIQSKNGLGKIIVPNGKCNFQVACYFSGRVYMCWNLKSHMDSPPPNANVEPIAVAISQGKTSSKYPIPCGFSRPSGNVSGHSPWFPWRPRSHIIYHGEFKQSFNHAIGYILLYHILIYTIYDHRITMKIYHW